MKPKKKKEPRQARAKETVDAIIQSVVSLVNQGDVGSLTTTKIAERAGVSIGSLYQYFPAKEAIFSALIEWHWKKEFDLIQSALRRESEGGVEQAIDEILSRILAIRKKHLKLEQAMLRLFTRVGSEKFIRAFDLRMIAAIDEALCQLSSRYGIRRTDTTAFLLLHLIRSTFIAATLERPELYKEPGDLKENLKRVILALIQPPGA